jgi:hypothetical protein
VGDLNQADLALTAGTAIRFISDLENGKPSCHLGKTLAVIHALGIKPTLTPSIFSLATTMLTPRIFLLFTLHRTLSFIERVEATVTAWLDPSHVASTIATGIGTRIEFIRKIIS